MKKINILFVMIQMGMGGSEKIVQSLVKGIDRNKFSASVAWFYGDYIISEFQDLDVPLYHVPKKNRFDFSAMKKLDDIIKEKNIDIVNAHHFMSFVYSFYGCKIGNRIKLIYTEHSQWEIDKISYRWKIIGKILLKFADYVVGVSEKVSSSLKRNFELNQQILFTIQNGVDLRLYSSNYNKSFQKEKMGFSNKEKIVGIVANLKKVKNHLMLLSAFKLLIEDYQNVSLLIIGKNFEGDIQGSDKEIKQFIYKNNLKNKVKLLGYRSDIPDLLSAMDVFCLTSHKEGLPISLIEAMAAGLPVIGTEVDGIKDVIIHGKNGFLIPPGNVNELKSALATLLKDRELNIKMGQESKKLAFNLYALDSSINKYQNLFY